MASANTINQTQLTIIDDATLMVST